MDRLGTPAALGFRMPAEWEPHEATWLAWPHERSDWPGRFAPVPHVYVDIIRHLTQGERVHLIVSNDEVAARVRTLLRRVAVPLEAVRFFLYPTNRSWTRDYCPIFVKNAQEERAVLDWRFNGWAKYANAERDDAVPALAAAELGLRDWQPECQGRRVVLEGGSIDVNGAGLILTTEECLLSDIQQRNPGLNRADYEQVFADYLHAPNTLWLRNGIAGDDTHGHVDDLARFVDEQTIVIAAEEDPGDANYGPLRENMALLREVSGGSLRIVPLPMPRPVVYEGQRLPASYANFYVANGSVLVPTFNDPADRLALNTLAGLFPKRTVVGIHCLDLVLGLGTLHCMTQQQPI